MTAIRNPYGFDSNVLAQRVDDWASSPAGVAQLKETQQAAQASAAAAEQILSVSQDLLQKPVTL